MYKKALSLFLTVIILLSSFPIIMASAGSASSANVTILANKTIAHPGDEIDFTVVLQQTGTQNTFEATLDIPDGLTYVSGSLTTIDKSLLGWDDFGKNDDYLLFSGYGSVSFTGENSITLATFKCTVDTDAVGEYDVGLLDVVADDASYNTKNPTVTSAKVTVMIPIKGVSLDKTTATVKTGSTVTLTPIFAPETATNKNVTWATSDSTVATVENGIVSGVKEGTATVTVKTEDGDYEAACAITVECGHNKGHNVEAEDSTCQKQGHGAYTVCDDCGRIISGSDEKLPLGGHNYIEKVEAEYLVSAATCNKKAVYYKSCSVCGAKSTETFEYGEFNSSNHIGSTYKANQKEATCYEEGYTGDIYCSDCNAKLSSGTVIGKTAHNPASTWSTDENYHWHDCQTVGCGNLIDKAAHSGGEATCTRKAVCSVCGVEYGELDTNNHKNTEVRNAKSATCCEDGYTGDTYCKDCGQKIEIGSVIPATGKHVDVDGKWETDGTSHWHTCYYGTKFDVTSHTGGTATCKDKAVCSVCGVSYGELDSHNHTGGTEVRDAVSASCSTNGYTGDTYCKGCNAKLQSGSVIQATGDHVDADGEWECNGTQHYHTCFCGATFDYTNHSGGTATCKDKAVCSVCGTSYGELDASNHTGTTYKVNQKEATCYEEGYTGDIYCSDCNAKLSSGTVIQKNAHNPASTWSTDENYHWHDCQTVGCGNLIDKAAHSGGEATCTHKAVCSVCGVEYGEVDANNHKNTEVRNAKAATCSEAGYAGDTYCKDCGKKISSGSVIPATGNHIDADGKWECDGTQHYHTCSCGATFDYSNHSGGTATCKDKAVCSVCGTSYGEVDASNHAGGAEVRGKSNATCSTPGYTGDTYCKGCNTKIQSGATIPATGNHVDADGEWECNGTQHYHTCTCGAMFDYTNHSGGTATCKDKAVCSVCGTSYGELDASNHTGTTYKVNQKEATCYEEGYTGDIYCSDCNAKLSSGTVIQKNAHNPASTWSTDENYHWHDCQTIGCGNLIDKAAHTGGEATCTHKAVCSVCGVEYGEVDANNHKNTEVRNAKAATCCEDGYTGDTYCKDCGQKIESGSVIPATGKHVDVDGKWETDGTSHWHTCYYGTKFDVTSHTGGTATCKDKAVCSVCGVSYGELDSHNHTGGTEIKNAKEAKCNAEGYTGDTYCKGCGIKLESGESIDKISHNITSWNVTKEATTTECGEKTGRCTSCGEEFKTETAKLTSKPIDEKNTEYEGMKTAPKLVPSGDTVLPENAVFVAEKKNTADLTTEEKAEVDKAVKALEADISAYVGEGKKAEKVDVLCVFNFDLLLRNADKQSGDSLGDEEYHFNGSVNVTVEMPEAMKTAKNPCIVHLKDDGTCEPVKFTVNNDGTISFTVTGFSSFVLLDVETTAVTEKDDTPTSPQTGDDSMMTLWIILFAASSAGLVLSTIGRKKKVR